MPRRLMNGLDDHIIPGNPVPGDYEVEVISTEAKTAKTGREFDEFKLRVISGPELDNGAPADAFEGTFRFRILQPMPGDTQNATNFFKTWTKRACEAFGVEIVGDGFDSDEFIGRTGGVQMVKQKDDERYLEVNTFFAP